MNPEQATLFEQIQAFAFDEPGTRVGFVARLSQEQGWSRRHAERVVEEYRKFVLLAAAAGHRVSPSRQVDQAWHLHLCDTRSYWERFCPRVLGRPLHHEPSRGGSAEALELGRVYACTLASYRALFATDPPADIWPCPERQAVHARAGRGGRSSYLPALAGAGSVLPAGCADSASELLAGAIMVGTFALVGWLWRRFEARDAKGGGPSGCSHLGACHGIAGAFGTGSDASGGSAGGGGDDGGAGSGGAAGCGAGCSSGGGCGGGCGGE